MINNFNNRDKKTNGYHESPFESQQIPFGLCCTGIQKKKVLETPAPFVIMIIDVNKLVVANNKKHVFQLDIGKFDIWNTLD